MTWVLIIVGGIVAVIVLAVVVQSVSKGNCAKAVYRELEGMPDAGFIHEVRTNPDEEIKMQVSMLQIEVLKRCYANKVPPAGAAMAIAGAVEEMYTGGPPPE